MANHAQWGNKVRFGTGTGLMSSPIVPALPCRIVSIYAEEFHTPLHSPFVTSQGSTSVARAVAVHLTLEDGRTARGESVPVTYVTGETLVTVIEAIERVREILVGQDIYRYRPCLSLIAEALPGMPSARCGLEMAVFAAWSAASGSSLWQILGGAQLSVCSDVTIPIVQNAGELAAAAWELGIDIFKIKVGGGAIEEDYARVAAVREAAPEARLRIDANQAFTPDSAIAFVEKLVAEGAQIELLEQPVPAEDFAGLAEVARRSPVPVFADESCRTPADALRLLDTPVHGFNLKIQKSGIAAVLDIIAIARAADRKLMLGCMLETRYSIAVSLAIACGTGAFDFIDLDSHLLVDETGDIPYFTQTGTCLTLPF